MIEFNNLCKEIPYIILKEKYDLALAAKQKNIEAVCISSYSTNLKEVSSRFVNLKFINGKEFVFFSNYDSRKSKDFDTHKQIAATFFWNRINTQIRIKAKIDKTTQEFNDLYFKKRNKRKNALAISSHQSRLISSYDEVIKNFDKTLKLGNLDRCPKYWGCFSFKPYSFEFWEGNESRINKRDIYELKNKVFIHSTLQP